MLLLLIIFSIRSFILRKKDIPVELFVEALRKENNGYFETAVVTYESALDAVKKSRVHNYLKNKIVEKLKVLHTIIEYKNSLHFIKQYNSIDMTGEGCIVKNDFMKSGYA